MNTYVTGRTNHADIMAVVAAAAAWAFHLHLAVSKRSTEIVII